ncbi:MAG: hypothetical protein ACK53G_06870 [Armatimonadota bacterium]|jgi:hypothetical protein|nr:hypothetical protein [Fimbriimonadaceae bacterium]MCE2767746.1 hypothetical protein [Fimbriimonadaceae bacterium]
MRWTETRITNVLTELIDDNPIVIRPLLKVVTPRFSTDIKTLAVTLMDPPELLINQEFIEKHCTTDLHLKGALLHEFLHVILGHTMKFNSMTRTTNIALDAIINAIIYRLAGEPYTVLFSEYYKSERGIGQLLRPQTTADKNNDSWQGSQYGRNVFIRMWDNLYKGQLVSDDIIEIASTLGRQGGKSISSDRFLIGNHKSIRTKSKTRSQGVGETMSEAINKTMRQMNGRGIWRMPLNHGVGTSACKVIVPIKSESMEQWEFQTLVALKRAVIPKSNGGLKENRTQSFSLPILTPRDRRAFLKANWSPFIPSAENTFTGMEKIGSANVYLDVSGSMNDEMPVILSILNKLRYAIQLPFWAFSDEVSPATIVDGKLQTNSTGGTSMSSVLKHIAKERPLCAVVITDGYIERVSQALLEKTKGTKITAIVTRKGSTSEIEHAGIPCIQLGSYPGGN